MALDSFTLLLLVTRGDAPPQTDAERAATQDAHLSHLADLHETGHLVAAGPVQDPGGRLRGIGIFACDAERAAALMEDDPAVVAGWFSLELLPWFAPAGTVELSAAPFPRSAVEAVTG